MNKNAFWRENLVHSWPFHRRIQGRLLSAFSKQKKGGISKDSEEFSRLHSAIYYPMPKTYVWTELSEASLTYLCVFTLLDLVARSWLRVTIWQLFLLIATGCIISIKIMHSALQWVSKSFKIILTEALTFHFHGGDFECWRFLLCFSLQDAFKVFYASCRIPFIYYTFLVKLRHYSCRVSE